MRLHAEYVLFGGLESRGSWCVCARNGHVVAEMATKGKNKRAEQVAHQMAEAFNSSERDREFWRRHQRYQREAQS